MVQFLKEDEAFVKELIELRKVKKEEPVEITEQMKKIIDEEYHKAHQAVQEFRVRKDEPAEVIQKRNEWRERGLGYYLGMAKKLLKEME